mmetsp:Transcript_28837/g.52679  ORF Transcript_28837/g.52679 Transcript_28837/m.52679 type:complete len:90 (-) Transcript_28837:18-287(-)
MPSCVDDHDDDDDDEKGDDDDDEWDMMGVMMGVLLLHRGDGAMMAVLRCVYFWVTKAVAESGLVVVSTAMSTAGMDATMVGIMASFMFF